MGADSSGARGFLATAARLVETELHKQLDSRPEIPSRLRAAIEHSLFAGGKRLRPALCLAAAELVGAPPQTALPGACALEMIHTYSLIHDDLPAMDDDNLRRGKPTCHVEFGEAAAILAGDALLTEAFAVLASAKAGPGRVRRAVLELARAAGAEGMVGGQQLDLEGEGSTSTVEKAAAIHEKKTAALLRAAVLLGAILAGASDEDVDALGEYGRALGLAFQVADDVLDATSSAEDLGKSPGKDLAAGKITYVAAVGVDEALKRARELADEAVAALAAFGESPAAAVLRELAVLAAQRRS